MDDDITYVDTDDNVTQIDDSVYNIRNVHNYTDGSNIKNDTNIDNVKKTTQRQRNRRKRRSRSKTMNDKDVQMLRPRFEPQISVKLLQLFVSALKSLYANNPNKTDHRKCFIDLENYLLRFYFITSNQMHYSVLQTSEKGVLNIWTVMQKQAREYWKEISLSTIIL